MARQETSIDKASLDNIKKTHLNFSEEIDILKQSLPYIHKEKAFNDIKNVVSFFNEHISAHFTEEEQRLFSVGLVIGTPRIKQAVRELQHEHITMLGKFDIIRDTVSKYGFSFPGKEIRENFVALSKELVELLLQHARKEDEELFPFLEGKGIDTNVSK